MVEAKGINNVLFIRARDGLVVSVPLLKEDTVDNFPNALKYFTEYLEENELDKSGFKLALKPCSNISIDNVNDKDKYVLIFNTLDGQYKAKLNKSKAYIEHQLRAMKLLHTHKLYENTAIYKSSDLLDIEELQRRLLENKGE